jgi:hypothetical protein
MHLGFPVFYGVHETSYSVHPFPIVTSQQIHPQECLYKAEIYIIAFNIFGQEVPFRLACMKGGGRSTDQNTCGGRKRFADGIGSHGEFERSGADRKGLRWKEWIATVFCRQVSLIDIHARRAEQCSC